MARRFCLAGCCVASASMTVAIASANSAPEPEPAAVFRATVVVAMTGSASPPAVAGADGKWFHDFRQG